MSPARALALARRHGIEFEARGGRLRWRASVQSPEELLDLLRAMKPALIALFPPWTACEACAGVRFWADANEPVGEARWRCERCEPQPAKQPRRACVLRHSAWPL